MTDDRIRAELHGVVPEPPEGDDLFGAVASRVASRHRRHRAIGGGVAALALVATGALAVSRAATRDRVVHVGGPTIAGATTSTPPPTTPAAPPGSGCRTDLRAHQGPGMKMNPTRLSDLDPEGFEVAQLCRYAGGDELLPGGSLAGSARLDGARLRRLVDDLRHLTPASPVAFSCPFDDGASVSIRLLSEHHLPVVLDVHLGGCQFVSGGTSGYHSYGSLDAPGSGAPSRLQADLAAAVGQPWTGPIGNGGPGSTDPCVDHSQPSQLPAAGTKYVPWPRAALAAEGVADLARVTIAPDSMQGWFTCFGRVAEGLHHPKRVKAGMSADHPVWVVRFVALAPHGAPRSGAATYTVVVDAVTGKVFDAATPD